MVGQQVQRHPLARRPVGPIRFGQGQLQGLQATEIAIGQQGQGVHGPGVVQAPMGSPPLQQQRALPGVIPGRPDALQHGQCRLGRATGQQRLGGGQGLRLVRLGRETRLQADLLFPQGREIPPLAQGPALLKRGFSQHRRPGQGAEQQRGQ